jgi:GTP-binding protein EngB required for normal cell division
VRRVLADAANRLVVEARQLLAGLRDSLVAFGATADDRAALVASIHQLDELFLLVVVGEFNAGKSAFINALVGQAVLQEGVTPTTARIHLLAYGESLSRRTAPDGVEVVTAPADALRDVHVVDTPGTNAIIREHERLTSEFVPRSDLVLFITSADRPFTESERAFLGSIAEWGKKIVVIINKIDILPHASEREEVSAFVRGAATRMLGVAPDLFTVSARLAQRAKAGEPSLWATSGFEALEHFLQKTLDENRRFQLKLANPIGVGQALAGRYARIAEERLAVLRDDLALLADVERQVAVYRADLAAGFDLRMSAVEKVLIEMEARGHRYVEETMRIGRVLDLLNRVRVQKEFEDKVVADAPREIERRVAELIDWSIEHDFRQWQAVTAMLAARRREHASRLLGEDEVGTFTSDRRRLMDSVGREAQRVVDSYDKQREAERIADDARAAVTTAAAAGGAAVGLGTLVTVAASTLAADVTGFLMASLLAALGFLVIPAKRRKAKATLQGKVSALRERLASALRAEFERAQERSANRIAEAIAPYARFVRAEEGRWSTAHAELTSFQVRAASILAQLTEPAAAHR